MILTILCVSGIFGFLYLAFIGVFFLVFSAFKKTLDQEAIQKEKDDQERKN